MFVCFEGIKYLYSFTLCPCWTFPKATTITPHLIKYQFRVEKYTNVCISYSLPYHGTYTFKLANDILPFKTEIVYKHALSFQSSPILFRVLQVA